MGSINGKALHIDEINNGIGNSVPRSQEWIGINARKAQSIIKTQEASALQWQQLSKRLYNSALKSHLTDGDFLLNATRIVVEWDSEVSGPLSLAGLRRIISMSRFGRWQGDIRLLKDWQLDLAEKIANKDETLRIYYFKESGTDNIWVCISNPSTEVIYEYCQQYVDIIRPYLKDNPDIDYDFLVLGEDEINNSEIPEDAIILYVKE